MQTIQTPESQYLRPAKEWGTVLFDRFDTRTLRKLILNGNSRDRLITAAKLGIATAEEIFDTGRLILESGETHDTNNNSRLTVREAGKVLSSILPAPTSQDESPLTAALEIISKPASICATVKVYDYFNCPAVEAN